MAKKETKLCKSCKTEIPAGAKICPNCKKKQGGILKWAIVVVVVLLVIGAFGSRDNEEQPKEEKGKTEAGNIKEEEEKIIEYIPVTADELSEALSENAMKAKNDYEEKYLEITGKLGNIDSDGKYIGLDTDSFSLTNIQCYMETEEQKEIIMGMSRGDTIVIKGYCKDIGEILGYRIEIKEVIK